MEYSILQDSGKNQSVDMRMAIEQRPLGLNAICPACISIIHAQGFFEIKQWGKVKRVPVISWAQAGSWKEAYDPEHYSEFVETATKGELALRVEGDSMEPEFHEGDIIVVNPHRKQEHNDYVVICNAEYEATLKQLKKYGQARVLHPLNPKYDDIELTKNGGHILIGVVAEKKRSY